MSFFNIEKFKMQLTDEQMLETLNRLKEFEIYHCLRQGSLSAAIKVQNELGYVPQSYLLWVKNCDGGLLFDTVLLSSTSYDKDLDLDFDSYYDCNETTARASFALPDNLSAFALRSYGAPLCFDNRLKNEKVYLWNCENQAVEVVWDSFEDWLTDEVDSAIQLIAEGVLEPLNIKLSGDENGE